MERERDRKQKRRIGKEVHCRKGGRENGERERV